MGDGAALLAAIADAPNDDAPKLIYADWLSEHGFYELETFIRRGLKYPTEEWRYAPYKQGAWSHSYYSRCDIGGGGVVLTPTPVDKDMEQWFEGYAAELCKIVPHTRNWTYVWRKGFVCRIEGLTSTDWLDFCDQLTKTFPLISVELRTRLTFGSDSAFHQVERELVTHHRPQPTGTCYLTASEGFDSSRKKRITKAQPGTYQNLTAIAMASGGHLLQYLVATEWPKIKIEMPAERERTRRLLSSSGIDDEDDAGDPP